MVAVVVGPWIAATAVQSAIPPLIVHVSLRYSNSLLTINWASLGPSIRVAAWGNKTDLVSKIQRASHQVCVISGVLTCTNETIV